MTTLILWLAAKLALVVFGLPIAFAPRMRRLGVAARLAAAFGCGAIALTLLAMLLSAISVRWSVATIALPLVFVSAALSWLLARAADQEQDHRPLFDRASLPAWIAIVASWLHWTLAIFSTRATSADYLYFWGSKAARFAAVRGIDTALLGDPFMVHLRGPYPPLVPITYAWNAILAGAMHWRATMLDSALWLIAASLLIHALLAQKLSPSRAALVTAFWTAALAVSFSYSYSGGNAESQLIYFASVGALALFSERRIATLLAPIALAGAMLTKSEGTLLWAALLGSAVLLRFLTRRWPVTKDLVLTAAIPLLALVSWYWFEIAQGLSLSDPLRQNVIVLDFSRFWPVFTTLVSNLHAGTFGASWIVPLVAFALLWRGWRSGLGPALTTFGLLAFYVVYYFHEKRPLEIVMWWEIPRITQPLLSFLILAAALAWSDAGSNQSGTAVMPVTPVEPSPVSVD